MDSTEPGIFAQSASLLERLAFNCGFHDLTSLLLSLLAVAVIVAFVISAALFLTKSRAARKKALLEVVTEAQKETSPEEQSAPKPEEPAVDLGIALSKTRHGFIAKLRNVFSRTSEISQDDVLKLEEILFTADIGTKTASKLLERFNERAHKNKDVGQKDYEALLKEEMLAILKAPQAPKPPEGHPTVVMVVGVNGAGKTTSVGKLGANFVALGKKVVFGAGDTFRAAAVKQLQIWGERVSALVVTGAEKADSASVLFDAVNRGKDTGADIVICDTAGRLHTKTELMDELKKVYRVLGKAAAGAPHEVLLVIDATMGQNAIVQAREFAAVTPLSGIILTKLDGTAKGGVALGIVDELGVPIRYVGVGEKAEDLKEFIPEEFVEALFT